MAHRIMLADDAAFMRKMIKDILTKNDYEVIDNPADGLQAVEEYTRSRPDLVLMDITMPNMDGLTALKEIKKMDPGAKIVMCSAMGQEKMVLEAIKAGAIDFIVKPFNADKIVQTVKRILG